MRRTFRKYFLYALLVSAISGFLVPIFIHTKPYIVPFSSSLSAPKSHTIYITNHGWHTGVVLPAHFLHTRLPQLATRFPNYDFLEVGWGDAGFYQNEKITVALTLNAIFTPSDTVMHVVGIKGSPVDVFAYSQVVSLTLSEAQLQNITTFIEKSFKLNIDNRLIPQQFGRYGDSQFYAAVGKYYAFNTCNKWTAKALASAGVDIRTAYKLTASSVTNHFIK